MKIWVTENNVVHHRKPRSVATVEYVQVTKTPENVSCENLSNVPDTQGALDESSGEMLHRLGLNGRLWAKEFIKLNPDCNVDEDTLFGWFANAIMAGVDNGNIINGDHMDFLIQRQSEDNALARPSREAKDA